MNDAALKQTPFISQLLKAGLLVVGLGTLVILLYYPSQHPLGNSFDIAVIYMYTRWVALWWAIAMFVLRLLLRSRIRKRFLYVLCAVLNVSVGLIATYLFFFHHQTLYWLHLCLLNLLLGAIQLVDSAWDYLFKKV